MNYIGQYIWCKLKTKIEKKDVVPGWWYKLSVGESLETPREFAWWYWGDLGVSAPPLSEKCSNPLF